MPAINFKKQFAPDVESGKKRQTIRALRKDGRNPKPGQTLYLYTGMRTNGCKKLVTHKCLSAEPIIIYSTGVKINMKDLTFNEIKKLAKKDGFKNHSDFMQFFNKTHGLPFAGYLIKW